MEALGRLQAPGLALLALFLRPGDWPPVRRQHKACTGIGYLDPVAARLVDIEEEGLLDGVLVGPGLDEDSVLEEHVGSSQDVLAAVDGVADVVEAALHAMSLASIGEVVALVRAGQPHARLRAAVQHDPLGETKAKIALEELPIGLHIDRKAVEMIEAAHTY